MPTNFDVRKQKLCHQMHFIWFCADQIHKNLRCFILKRLITFEIVSDISGETFQFLHFRGHMRPLTFFKPAYIRMNLRTTEKYMCNHHSVKWTYFSSQHYSNDKKYKRANLITAKLKTISKSFKGQLPLCLCKVTIMHILINCKW